MKVLKSLQTNHLLNCFKEHDYPILMDRLRKTESFPGVCYKASQIVSAYFEKKHDVKLPIVVGTFGVNQLFHAWLMYGEHVVDLTMFQFHKDRLSQRMYKKIATEELIRHIDDCQSGIIIDEQVSRQFHRKLIEVEPEYLVLFEEGMTFGDFLERVVETDVFTNSNWLNGKVSKEGTTFSDWLIQNNKRVTKKYFTKYSIV